MQGYDAANLEAMSFAIGYQQAMADLVVKKLNLTKDDDGALLDFGSGRGDYAKILQNKTSRHVTGLEPDLSLHSYYPSGIKVHADLDKLDISPNAVYSLNVFEHIEDDVSVLRNLAKICKPHVPIFILVPAYPHLWTPMDTLVGHQRRYTPDILKAAVSKAGLEILEDGWFDRTGYFVTLAYKILQKVRQNQSHGAVSKYQIKLFDALFKMIEPAFAGLRLPFGKNCWVLARTPASSEYKHLF